MDLTTWLRRWLTRHPLKEPSDTELARYTTEVMARVRSLERPAPAGAPARGWLLWWRPALVTVTAAAAVVLLVGRVDRTPQPLARDVNRVTDGARANRTDRPLMLTEDASDEARWLDNTLQVLDEFDQDVPEDISDDENVSDDEWLREIEMLDESDLLAGS